MAGFGFHRDIANNELDIQVAGTVALTLSTTDITFPVSTVTYGGRGTALQATNHSTGVTVNATSGTITLASVDLAFTEEQTFVVTNSFVSVGDVVVVNVQTNNDGGTPQVGIDQVNSGNFHILLSNPHVNAAAFNTATTLNFPVIKPAAYKAV